MTRQHAVRRARRPGAHDVLAGSFRLLAGSWRQDRRKLAVAVLLVLAGAVSGPLAAVALRGVINTVLAGRLGSAAAADVAVAALTIAGLTFATFAHVSYFELAELSMLEFSQQIISLSNGSPGLGHHEQPRLADEITILDQQVQELRTGFEALLGLAGLGVAGVVTAVLLALLNPLLLLLPLATVPPLLTGRRAERIIDRARSATATRTRQALGFFHLATTAGPAKELRVLGLQEELQRRHRDTWDSATRVLWRGQLRAAAAHGGGQCAFAIGYIGAVLLVLRAAAGGRQSVGDVVLVIALATQVNLEAVTAVALLQRLQRVTSAFRRLAGVRLEVLPPATGARVTGRVPGRLKRGIELADVTFAYPGSDEPVLRNVSLFLPAGSTIALVGENGAGKTTLVKLLCGLYQPTSGAILIDGVDMSCLPPDEWWQRTAACFQDFVRFEFLVREVVGIGDLPELKSAGAIWSALDRVRGGDVVEQLENGLDTQLGKTYAEGAELSGGQWQKLALGRAFMRAAPLLLALDEPTSALDARAEHGLLEKYADQASRVSQVTGGITVLVSHRLSAVRMADLIAVVADGRIAEAGDHARLTANRGIYAELYGLQAAAYR
jgi:ATP-binding cassette subfamily B protein